MDRLSIVDKLRRIDERLSIEFGKTLDDGIGIVVVGGSAIALAELADTRKTKDIDILEYSYDYHAVFFEDPDINAACNAFALNVPYNYQDRLVEVDGLDFRALHVFRPALEDLAVMKLYRWEKPDVEDLMAQDVLRAMDWSALAAAVEEAWFSRIGADPRKDAGYQQMLFNYRQYLEMAGR